ncbi:MAG TPA: transcriptional regulator [Candidatus Competibacter sp.]|nr:transcriptional regulator [Candidatus Competibacter sp.]
MPSKKTRPLTDAELEAHEATRDLGAELLESIREMKAGKWQVAFSPAIEARKQTGLSQSQFAAFLGVSVRTLQGRQRSGSIARPSDRKTP